MHLETQLTYTYGIFISFPINTKHQSDPSIDSDTPFKSCKSSDKIFSQEISNHRKSQVMDDIKEQLHYETWREVERIYKISSEASDERKSVARDEL